MEKRTITRCLVASLVAIVMVCSLSTVTAFASTSLSQKAQKAEKALVNAAEYYGWTVDEMSKSNAGNKSVIVVNIRNSKHVFGNVRVTATSKKVYYRYKGKNHTLRDWKLGLKKYAVKADKKAVVKNKTKTAIDKLKSYATKRGWTVKSISNSYKSGKSVRIVRIKNEMFSKTVTVTAQRKKGKVAVSYKLGKSKSSAKAIKKWLNDKRAGVAFGVGESSGPTNLPVPPAPAADDLVSDEPDYQVYDDPSIAGVNADVDTGTTGEPTPAP